MNMDYCWSDNLLFPYEYNKKTIITGSFLWTNNSKYLLKDLDLKILNKKDVKLIGNRYFTSPDTRKNLRFFPVGMLDDIETNKKNHKQINSILISSGNTQNGIDFLYHQILNNKDYLENISRNCKLYIEANIYDNIKFHSKNIKKATFSRSMYEEIGSAIARPGMGTITDSWNSGIKVFPFFGENDIELIHNSKVVKKIQGDKDQSSTNLIFQIKKALKYNKSLRMKKKQMKILYSLDNKGIDDTASYLEKFFKGEIN